MANKIIGLLQAGRTCALRFRLMAEKYLREYWDVCLKVMDGMQY